MGGWESLLPQENGNNSQPLTGPSLSSIWQHEFQNPTGSPATPNAAGQQQESFAQTEANAMRTGVLTLQYGDPDMDQELAAGNYQRIVINTPAGVQLKNWEDQNGFFFWFQGGNDSNAKHYYPATAQEMTVNGQTYDLDSERLQVSQEYAAQASGAPSGPTGFTGFQTFSNSTNAITYFERMSQLSASSLSVLQNALASSAYTSKNPYFKIYLADVYTAEAMQPIVSQVMNSGTANLDNPQTLQKIDQAIQLLQAAQQDSGQYNQSAGSGALPLWPYSMYTTPGNYNSYGYYAGNSLVQSQYREAALTVLRNLITSHALPQIQLPPALPAG